MPPRPLRLLLLLLAMALVGPPAAAVGVDGDLADRVLVQLEELGSPDADDRDAAERELVKLAEGAPERGERVLAELPDDNRSIPPAVQAAIERVRIRIQRGMAQRATATSEVTLRVAQAPLAEVLAEFTKQTGAVFRDNRAAFGGEATPTPITLSLDEEPFWSALDQLLDAAKLSVYPYGAEGEITLVQREATARRRNGSACYTGPFRFEALSLSATRGLRDSDASRLDLVVEASWEPRLRPIALSQPLQALTVTGSDGKPLLPRTPEQSIDLEATAGEQALSMTLSLLLPDRRVERIENVTGQLTAMIPATRHKFRVEGVGAAALPLVQEFGDATVTLNRFRKVNAIWELHMRLRLRGAGDALASHRGWVFQNASYLVGADGKRIEHAGFETTMQTPDEIGIAYLFDLSGNDEMDFNADAVEADGADKAPPALDPKNLAWVYETPTGVYSVPVSWELGPIDLP